MKIMIATPMYGAAATGIYVNSLYKLSAECTRAGINTAFVMTADSLVTRARNRCVAKFLAADSYTHLFWIDGDIGFKPDQFARLLVADRDVVAGVYPLKAYRWPEDGLPEKLTKTQFEDQYVRFAFNLLDGKVKSDEDGFGEVLEAPNGFMCIKRHVFDKMRDAYPELAYDPVELQNDDPKDGYWGFFDSMIEPGTKRYLSEDFAFCRRWRDIGGQVFADLHSELSHQGQHVWRGDLIEHLRTSKWRKSP